MKINTDLLTIVREARGLTQRELSDIAQISQAAISKYENGLIEVPKDHLADIANVLGTPESLFLQKELIEGQTGACLYHRKRRLTVRELRRINAIVILMGVRIARLLRSAEIEPTYPFPRFDVSEYGGPEQIAMLVRRTWRLPVGPIRSLVYAIEAAGGIVVPVRFGNRKLDAISQWPKGLPPLFFINTTMPFERIRFSLAHELGHLVMHEIPTPDQEAEADRFAASFLMPVDVIRPELEFLSIPTAAQMKPRWRVSMQAIIRRAYDLHAISESKYRRLFTEIGRLGYRLREPAPIEPEEPMTLRRIIDVHLNEHRYSLSEVSGLLNINEGEFKRDYLMIPETGITMIA